MFNATDEYIILPYLLGV